MFFLLFQYPLWLFLEGVDGQVAGLIETKINCIQHEFENFFMQGNNLLECMTLSIGYLKIVVYYWDFYGTGCGWSGCWIKVKLAQFYVTSKLFQVRVATFVTFILLNCITVLICSDKSFCLICFSL